MRKLQMLLGGAAIGTLLLAGCATKPTQADPDALNQTREYSQMAEQSAQAAQAAADKVEMAVNRLESAASRAETAAAAAERSAAQAAENAGKSTRAFEMGQMK